MGNAPDPAGATITSSANALKPVDGPIPVPTLTLVFGPVEGRWGERVRPGSRPLPLDRVSRVFPGGALDDPDVSRVHADVVPEADGSFSVRDLGSKNGTFVNGSSVAGGKRILRPGDIIRVGDSLILFHATFEPAPADGGVDGFLGIGDGARQVRGSLVRVAARGTPVLLLGESGTGKEVAARALGALGRPGRPFVAFNAAAVPSTLADSMLFGHLKGAFTDAREARSGVFRAADTGTLFLDEVGELPIETQVKLLRVLEDQSVMPLGASRPVPVDVRIVAATNRDLLGEVRAGRFRGDLYARLAGVVINMPALRDRPEDIPLMAAGFAREGRFSVNAMLRLLMHSWPFNVRELKAAVDQAVAEWNGRGALELPPVLLERMEQHRRILKPAGSGGGSGAGDDDAARTTGLDARTVRQALERHHGNMAQAAAEVGKDRGQFYRIVRRLGLDPEKFR